MENAKCIAFGKMSRRDMLRVSLAASAGVALNPLGIPLANAQAFNWQRFRGKELYAIFFRNPWPDEIVKYIPEFEALTGIKVNCEVPGASGAPEVHRRDDRRLRRPGCIPELHGD